jgi:O-antigen biosynthesis protein WbqP
MALFIILGVILLLMSVLAVMKQPGYIYKNEKSEQNPMQGKNVRFVASETDPENADGVRGHLIAVGETSHKAGLYEAVIKRFFDIALSFLGVVILSPLFLFLFIWIWIDDPGPILFKQKRIGKDKRYFKIHKFRTMKMNAPHDLSTHCLGDSEPYLTRAGRFIREHSLDELPQIWDIFVGNMSVIGPRPVIWNEDGLIVERDCWGANDIKPGLTGWAQINGRDNLSNVEKARLDGEYVKKMGILMDLKCFFKSFGVVFKKDSSALGKDLICETDCTADDKKKRA